MFNITVIILIAKPEVMIPLGSRTLMGVIMGKDVYAIGTDQGRLKSRCKHNHFDVCPSKF